MNLITFKNLTLQEKKNLYNFIYRVDRNFDKNYEEMIQFFESEVFEYGNQLFISHINGNIICCFGIITKEIEVCKMAYITEFYVKNYDLTLYKNNIKNILKDAVEFSISKGANKTSLGIRNEMLYLSDLIIDSGFKEVYDALIMNYEGQRILRQSNLNGNLKFKPLNLGNISNFTKLHNKAFNGECNAATITDEDSMLYLQNYKGNEELIGIIEEKNIDIGVYMLSKVDDIGWIDNIAIIKEYRGRGLGKELLNKCIEFLQIKKVNEIKLLVITSNYKAYRLYKSFGFKDEKIFSKWFEN